MARIRTIKPDFFTSESVGALSLHARLTFVGLWTYCDDAGRAKDNPRVIRGALWPNDEETVSSADVARFIDELVEHGMVCRYTHDGTAYLHAVNFNKHQTINKPSASKLPECSVHAKAAPPTPPVVPPEGSGTTPGGVPEDSGRPPGGLPGGSGSGSGMEGKGSNSSPSAPPPLPLAPLTETALGFDDFWKHWPRKTGKPTAAKAFANAVRKKRADPATIVAACQAFAERCRLVDRDPNFIPYASTWLNGERWADDLDAVLPLTRTLPNGHRPYQNPTDPDAHSGGIQ